MVVMLGLGENRAWGFFAQPQPAPGVYESTTQEPIRDFYDASQYDASDYAVAANRGGRIFYVGEGAETLARNIASETGYKTIYNTWYGKIGERVTPYVSQNTSRKMWDSLSARFANGTKQGDDVITVFGRHRATGEHTLPIDTKAAWKRIEFPILDSKGIPYRPLLTE